MTLLLKRLQDIGILTVIEGVLKVIMRRNVLGSLVEGWSFAFECIIYILQEDDHKFLAMMEKCISLSEFDVPKARGIYLLQFIFH